MPKITGLYNSILTGVSGDIGSFRNNILSPSCPEICNEPSQSKFLDLV